MPTQLYKIVNSKTRIPLGLFVLVWVIVLYMLPQKYQYLESFQVPRTFVDDAIPLTPHWIWIYVSYYFFLVAAYLNPQDEKNANQVFYSYAVSAIISTIIFFIFPTTISRDRYPLLETESWSGWMMHMIRLTDASLNCAPSMHCAMSTIAALTFLREKTWYRWPVASWALFIFYSTMATKQHYWWDVVTGVMFGAFIFGFFDRANYVEADFFESEKA